MKSENRKIYKFNADGLVQGVGYRYFVKRKADSLNLKGYVKNLYDGTVEVVAGCNSSELELLLELLKTGPMRSRVKTVDFTELEDFDLPNNFEIR